MFATSPTVTGTNNTESIHTMGVSHVVSVEKAGAAMAVPLAPNATRIPASS
ncbi:hypothetical protein PC128_g17346 [Phytophthora cactorum]|nr:hypothetical protein PC128_g17346 [Phytophthora cactorum]